MSLQFFAVSIVQLGLSGAGYGQELLTVEGILEVVYLEKPRSSFVNWSNLQWENDGVRSKYPKVPKF